MSPDAEDGAGGHGEPVPTGQCSCQACGGWQPTNSFALPMTAFKEKMRKSGASSATDQGLSRSISLFQKQGNWS